MSGSRAPLAATTNQLVLEEFLPYRLSILSNTVSNSIARDYRDRFGLTIPQWRVMAVLGRFGPMTPGDACNRTAMDKVTVSRAVARLIARGLVRRKPHPRDKRRAILALTGRGGQIHQQVMPIARSHEAELIDVLSGAERQQLDALLDKLQARADAIAGT